MKTAIPCLAVLLALSACGTARMAAVPENEDSQEELVNLGYQRVRRKNVTTSVSQLKVRDAQNYTNMYDYLRGRIAGVQVEGTSIYIRGKSSINADTSAMILVDGVETTNLDSLNPQDVSSVEVLKDASASIYGTRGANGVVLITTKKGNRD